MISISGISPYRTRRLYDVSYSIAPPHAGWRLFSPA
jgi:hypothetical protein